MKNEERKNKEREKKEKKKVRVGRESGDVSGKGGVRGKLKKKFFFFFFWVLHIAVFFEKFGYRSSFKKFYTPRPVKRNYRSPLKKLFG